MIYSVRAKINENKIFEFYKKLTDGTIYEQEPDGKEIVNSMKRAKLVENNTVQWSEMCFCSPPLKHERETVYDKYLTDIETKPIDDYEEYEGESFMQYLETRARSKVSN